MISEKNPHTKDDKNDDGLSWRQLMWKNFYIQGFVIALVAFIGEFYLIDTFYTLGGFMMGIALPLGVMMLIAYKGFFQFWKDYSKDQSR